MERQTDSQYDDDLTVGIGDYDDESIDTGYVDLFEFSGDEASPIARLKTIVLSIDWEITDEVLTQFNDELLDLQDIWADDPVKLVYVQALQKISKYIFQRKSDSHPSAIKLLLTFYYNLEKIVLDSDLSESDKKEILRSDVKKFEQLKRQIEAETAVAQKRTESVPGVSALSLSEQGAPHPVLFNLKACILGMDWEITERELSDLSREIRHLEVEFAGNKPRMLFLQGIEALGGYIKLKRSDAHADAFKLLYSFYEGLEKIVVNEMTLEEEKAVLFPEVEKFEQFKKIVSPTLSHPAIPADDADQPDPQHDYDDDSAISPAFADIPDEVHGFQADEEAAQLGNDLPDDVEGRLNQFFSTSSEVAAPDDRGEEIERESEQSLTRETADHVASFFDSEESRPVSSYPSISPEQALRGVDVETDADDDSGEEALPTEPDGKLAPALADTDEQRPEPLPDEHEAVVGPGVAESTDEIEERLGGFFNIDQEPAEAPASDAETALGGVDVETEADEENEEMALPLADDADLAPALSMGDDESMGDWPAAGEAEDVDIEERLDTLLADQGSVAPSALDGFDNDKEPEEEKTIPAPDDEVVPPLFDSDESVALEERLDSFFGEDENDTAAKPSITVEDRTEVEDQVAAFFEDADEATRPLTDLPATGDYADAVIDESEAVGGVPADSEADEVVFSGVEEGDQPPAGKELTEGIVEADETYSTFASESEEADFFAAIDERVDEPGEFQMELLDETDDIDTRTVSSLSEGEDIVPAPFDEAAEVTDSVAEDDDEDEEAYVFTSDDDLADLRAGIASLGVEINDNIIQGILTAVNGLRHRFTDRPVEKIFLQLISTIIQHIGQYRYEASAEAHGLVLSVFDKLELVQNPEVTPDQAQEILLTETTKILLWQQTMLDRQAIRKGDELIFMTPVRSDAPGIDETDSLDDDQFSTRSHGSSLEEPESTDQEDSDDFSAVFEPVEEAVHEPEPELTDQEDSDDFSAVFEPVEEVVHEPEPEQEREDDDAFFSLDEESALVSSDEEFPAPAVGDDLPGDRDLPGEEAGPRLADDGGFDPVTDFVKKELEALRISLQAEIEELRRRLED